ncbi:prephenate dehydrogenase [Staphylococcus sp. 11261D007BR]
MKNIFIVGLGLIGGSLASNLKYYYQHFNITAYDANPIQTERAASIGIIDEAIHHYEQGVNEADIIIYAAPVQTTTQYLNELHTLNTKSGLIVTDTGSTKMSIASFEEHLLQYDIHLIGGHPMAGSHKSGVLNSKKHLFENAFYILTYHLSQNEFAYHIIVDLLKYTKAKMIRLDADEHDFMTGVVSHVPHIMASSLVHINIQNHSEHTLIKELAAGGFRDITRIASSHPQMWKDIIIENKSHILTILNQLQTQVSNVIDAISSNNQDDLLQFFQEAKSYRDTLPVKKQGAMLSSFDLYIDIPDKAGMISKITSILSLHNISISNLKILEVREDIYGALRISFKNATDRDKAINALSDYHTYIA